MLNPSVLKPGQEQYEKFTYRGKARVQYDFRDTNGKLYSTVAGTLDQAREKVMRQIEKERG